jgi:uncharacterized RDD family membrane protein YckC
MKGDAKADTAKVDAAKADTAKADAVEADAVVGYLDREPTPLHLAGFWHRAAAGLLDLLLVGPLMVGVFAIWVAVLWVELPAGGVGVADWLMELPFVEDPLLVPGLLFSFYTVIVVLYFFTSWWSASPGQRILGIRVVATDGRTVGWGRAAVRMLVLSFAAGYLLLGVLWIGFDRLRQGWHDKIAGTLVVR